MGGLNTKIPGDPGSVEAAASWLRSVEDKVSGARGAIRNAQGTAQHSWQGDAGDAFCTRMGTADSKISDLSAGLSGYARACDDYAAHLRTAQSRMTQIRNEAAGHGLTVSGDVIENPGPGPAHPGSPPHAVGGPVPASVMQAAMDKYNAAVKAYNAHAKLVTAYNNASHQVEQVRNQYKTACDDLHRESVDPAVKEAIALNATDIAGQITGAAAKALTIHQLSASKKTFETMAQDALDKLHTTDYSSLGPDAKAILEHDSSVYFANRNAAESYAKELESLKDSKGGISGASVLSHGLLLAGMGFDIYHDWGDPRKVTGDLVGDPAGYEAGAVAGDATAGVVTGMLADTAAGAALGSAVPVVGTAVGAVVGAGVGIFATGAVKSLIDGGSIGDALGAGKDAVGDTIHGIDEGAKSVAHGVSHVASSVGHFVGDLF